MMEGSCSWRGRDQRQDSCDEQRCREEQQQEKLQHKHCNRGRYARKRTPCGSMKYVMGCADVSGE
eukprot:8882851-Karenia_brevis.AAC.1